MNDSLHFMATKLARSCDRLAQFMADMERHAARELRILDGYPTATMSDGTPTGGSELTSVESAAEQRRRITVPVDDIRDALISAQDIVDSAIELQRRVGTTRVAVPVQRCSGGMGHEGHLEWGDPTCEETVDTGGLCTKHRKRRYRWRQANGLDTSKDFAPAVPSEHSLSRST